MKKFRKVSSLIMALALVCSLAAVALANANANHSQAYTYPAGTVHESANIKQFRISGTIDVEDGSPLNSGNERRVTMNLWYIGEDETGDPTTYKWNGLLSAYDDTPSVTVVKTFTTNEINTYNMVCLSYANATFKAYVYTAGASEYHNHGPVYISYMML